ncbi:MAG TPA: hypothetical protein VF210_06175 [Pseudomonadales bacterium]
MIEPRAVAPWRAARLAVLAALCCVAGCSEPAPPPSESRQPDSTAVAAQAPFVDRHGLEDVRVLEVLVEGERERRPARRWDSPQGYSIYVLPQIVMTAEEPGRDQAFARVDGEFFARIERLDPSVPASALEQNARDWLAAIGPAERLGDARVPHPFLRDAVFVLRAAGAGVSAYVAVIAVDDVPFRFTVHLPHREPLEGIAPSLWTMLQSIEPWPDARRGDQQKEGR